MARNQHLVGRLAGQVQLAIRQSTRLQRRVDAYLVFTLLEREQLVVADAKSPGLSVVRGAIGDPVRLLRQCVQMRPEFIQGQTAMERHTIVDYVQVVTPEVDDAFPVPVLDIGVANIPLAWHGPIEDAHPCWRLAQFQRNELLEYLQRSPNALPCDAAADRVEVMSELEHLPTGPEKDQTT